MQVSNDSDQLNDDGTRNNSLNDRMYICVSVYTQRVSDLQKERMMKRGKMLKSESVRLFGSSLCYSYHFFCKFEIMV